MPRVRALVALLALLIVVTPAAGQPDPRVRTFAAPVERVWTVTRSTLLSLGWKVDKEDREVGWIVTKSRGVDHEEFGVYAKGTKHRLRVVLKGQSGGRTEVTIERRLWKEERILFVDKEEELSTPDRSVEKQVLDAIAKAL
jgi:hypothetical protein